jgi:hypothetical protein
MRDFIKCFSRDDNGTWTCVSSCEFDGPTGLIQVSTGSKFVPGTIFMGFDLVQLMEEHQENHGAKEPMPSRKLRDIDDAAIESMITTMLDTPNPEIQRKLQAYVERRYRSEMGIAEPNATPELLALIERAIDVLARRLPPDGLSDKETFSELYTIFDGPECRAAVTKARGVTRKEDQR